MAARTGSRAGRCTVNQSLWIWFALLCIAVNADTIDQAGGDEELGSIVDWESLLQTAEGAHKLHVTGNARVDAALEVGDSLSINGKVQAKSAAVFDSDVTVRGKKLTAGGADFVLGTTDELQQLSRKQNRALSHSESPVDSLHLNYQGDFEGGVVIGGETTTVEGTLVAKGQLKCDSRQPFELATDTIVLGKGDGKNQGGTGSNRALFHGNSPRHSLILNREGDFEGGVVVEGTALMTKGKLGVGTTEPKGTLHVASVKGSSEASILLSQQPGTAQGVFVKAKTAEGSSAVAMELGATASNPEGGLRVNFPGAVDFVGPAGCEQQAAGCKTVFGRGDTLFTSGRVGVGAKATTGLSYGITVDGAGGIGAPENDVMLAKGNLHLHGGLYDISTETGAWYLDLDKGGRLKSLNVLSGLGVGTDAPQSVFSDTKDGLLHVVDQAHPVAILESSKGKTASLVFKTTGSQFYVQQKDDSLTLASADKELLVLDQEGKVGFGTKNTGKYGVTVEMSSDDDSPLNDLSLPRGNLRLKGKVLDTFDGGDAYYLDLSKDSNLQDLNVEGKLSFGVKSPKFDIELQQGPRHITLGRTLFLNGFGGESAYVMNNAYVLPDGGYALEDKTKMASMLELKNNGRIELKATKEAGKQDWSMLLGMDATEDAVFAMGKFGVGVEKPDHAFQVAGGEAQLSLGNNLFLNGEGSTNVIAANAFIRKQQWVIQRKDRFATSIHLKDDGRVDMYGTAAQGSAEWRKMLGFNGPKHTVYAFGKMGINTENPTHTLTLPSGDHHISLGNNLFLNGAGTLTRIMGNSFMKLGKYTVANEHHHGLSIELNSAQSQIDFGGSQTKGSDNLLKLLSLNFVKKSVSLPSGSLGVKTTSPKVSLDVRGHMHLEDPSQAAVLYSPASPSRSLQILHV